MPFKLSEYCKYSFINHCLLLFFGFVPEMHFKLSEYCKYSFILHISQFRLQNTEKKCILYIIRIDVLLFVAAKFNIGSIFIRLVSTKNKNLCSLKQKIYGVFQANKQIYSHKNATGLWQK